MDYPALKASCEAIPGYQAGWTDEEVFAAGSAKTRGVALPSSALMSVLLVSGEYADLVLAQESADPDVRKGAINSVALLSDRDRIVDYDRQADREALARELARLETVLSEGTRTALAGLGLNKRSHFEAQGFVAGVALGHVVTARKPKVVS